MQLAPIHNHDLLTVRGQYGYKPALPAIGGREGLGVVDALGAGVEGLAVGQRVAAASGRGTWAEYSVAPARMVILMPDAIDHETAAPLRTEQRRAGKDGERTGRSRGNPRHTKKQTTKK